MCIFFFCARVFFSVVVVELSAGGGERKFRKLALIWKKSDIDITKKLKFCNLKQQTKKKMSATAAAAAHLSARAACSSAIRGSSRSCVYLSIFILSFLIDG